MGNFSSYQQHLEALISLGHKWYVHHDFDWYSCRGMPILAIVSLLKKPLKDWTIDEVYRVFRGILEESSNDALLIASMTFEYDV